MEEERHDGFLPPGQGYQTPPPHQPQPAHQPRPTYAPPPPAQQGGLPPPPPPHWAPQAQEPGNGVAVAALTCSIVSLGLLLTTVGLFFPVSLGLAIAGMITGRKGMANVDRGETRKHRDLAKAGWVLGIIALVLSVLAGAIVIALFIADPSWVEELDTSTDSSGDLSALVAMLGLP